MHTTQEKSKETSRDESPISISTISRQREAPLVRFRWFRSVGTNEHISKRIPVSASRGNLHLPDGANALLEAEAVAAIRSEEIRRVHAHLQRGRKLLARRERRASAVVPCGRGRSRRGGGVRFVGQTL